MSSKLAKPITIEAKDMGYKSDGKIKIIRVKIHNDSGGVRQRIIYLDGTLSVNKYGELKEQMHNGWFMNVDGMHESMGYIHTRGDGLCEL